MNLQPRTQTYSAPTQFLKNSVGIEYKTAGVTLEAASFADVAVDGYVKAGTAVYRGDNGLYQPWDGAAEGGTPATASGAGLTSHDVKLVDGSNPIVGLVVKAYPREDRCIGVNDAFKEATRGRLVFDV